MEDWDMFRFQNRKGSEKIAALINSMKLTVQELISIKERYDMEVEKEYKNAAESKVVR